MISEKHGPRDYVPASLFRHSAWATWKETQGWTHLELSTSVFARPSWTRWRVNVLLRPLGCGATMAYAPGAPARPLTHSPGTIGEEADLETGAALEEYSLRLQPFLPRDCAFLRWDPPIPAWIDSSGRAIDPRLQELRMNASTQRRRLRKAPTEMIFPETMTVDLGAGGVEARMAYRTRYSIRLASRRGTTVERVDDGGIEAFHQLHRATYALHGLPLQELKIFQDFFSIARDRGLGVDLYLARSEDHPVAAGVFVRNGEDAWYLFAASDPERRAAEGPTAVLGRALEDFSAAGISRLDLLGVAPAAAAPEHPLSGITLFKAGFGGQRRRRVGAWDYVYDLDAYAECSRNEWLSCT